MIDDKGKVGYVADLADMKRKLFIFNWDIKAKIVKFNAIYWRVNSTWTLMTFYLD